MSNFLKFLLLALPVIGVGVFSGYQNYKEPEKFAVEGVVIDIDWKSKNHGMPVIEIRPNAGSPKIFSSNRITLSSGQLKIGDSFIKVQGSKYCNINGVDIPCIN